ncbi:MAG: GNAT family N-acetyltransferase, partial [Pseudomonadota bacterium]
MGVTVSTETARLDVDRIHDYISTRSYWGQGRTRAEVERTIAASLCFGAYQAGDFVGFCRVVTDRVTVAYVLDLFVLEAHRGQGVAAQLVEAMLAHPELQTVVWYLSTRDAHRLYERYGFVATAPNRLMTKPPIA